MSLPDVPPDEGTFPEMIFYLNSIGGEPRLTVLITHLYTEYLMDWILRKKISRPNKILKRPFFSKLELIESFGVLSDDLMHELWLVNDVRNQFAHRIDITSENFKNEFSEKVRRMRYYNDQNYQWEGMTTYQIYHMIMIRVYSTLFHEYVAL